MNKANRKTIMIERDDIYSKEGDYVEVTEWSNGEGFDVSTQDQMYNISYIELKLIKKALIKSILIQKYSFCLKLPKFKAKMP